MAEIYQQQRSRELGLPQGTGKRYSAQDLEDFISEGDKAGYTMVGGVARLLTLEEKTALDDIRAKIVEESRLLIEPNARNFYDVMEGNTRDTDGRSVTVAFDTWEHKEDFLKRAVQVVGTEGLMRGYLGGKYIQTLYGVRLRPSALEIMVVWFDLRPVTIEDVQKAVVRRVSPNLFDIANLRNSPIGDSQKYRFG